MVDINSFTEKLFNISSHVPDLLWNIIIIISALCLGLILRAVIRKLFNLYNRFSDYFLFKAIIKYLDNPAGFFLPILMINLSLPLLQLNAKSFKFLDKIIEIGLIISFAALLMGVVRIFEDYVYHKYDLNKENNLKERKVRTQLQFIRKFIVVLIVLVTIAAILLSFENLRKIGAGLLTGVGIGGIIIGFAAQKSLGNLLAGFQIAFTQPLRIDDALLVEGEFGRVEEITLTYVVLKIWDERRLILPINYFIEKPFQNWTRASADITGVVLLYMDYTIPVDEVRKEFKRLLNANKLWDGRVMALQVTDSKEKTIELRVLVSARNSGEAFDLRCFIRENLISFIQQKYPQALPRERTEFPDRLST